MPIDCVRATRRGGGPARRRAPRWPSLRSARRRLQAGGRGWVVIGSGGRLGSTLCGLLPLAVGIRASSVDLFSLDTVLRLLRQAGARVVVNTAAFTHVDEAERSPGLAQAVNATMVGVLAEACGALNALLVQVSTDYVFGSDVQRRTPYAEDAPPAPVNVYGASKLAGERLAAAAPRHLIVRTSGLYGARSASKPGFVETIVRLAQQQPRLRVVADQWCSPSYALHVAQAIVRLVEAEGRGTFHAVNAGAASWYELACHAIRTAGLGAEVEPIPLAEYGHAAPRPHYTVLDTARHDRHTRVPLPPWQAAVVEYLRAA